MSREGTITVSHVWKRFHPDRRRRLLRDELQRLANRVAGRGGGSWVWALRDIDFKMEPGESLGLIGANGSGKSTLLKILTRVMYPYAGRVGVAGRVGALIEVAAGLHPDLTGRENVHIYGSLLGLQRREVTRRFDAIVAFAELEHAIDRQVKFYSSGMKMRLGFGVAAFLEPNVLLVDEVLAVGDASFQQRCLDRMREVLGQGTTLVYVSHDLPTVEASCTRGLWLHQGVAIRDGPIRDVLAEYRRAIEERFEGVERTSGTVRVVEATISGKADHQPRTRESLEAVLVLSCPLSTDAVIYLGISEGPGTPILLERKDVDLQRGKLEIRCVIADLPLPRGRFYLWVGVVTRQGQDLLPWSPAGSFFVMGPDLDTAPRGVVRLAPVFSDASWEVIHRESP